MPTVDGSLSYHHPFGDVDDVCEFRPRSGDRLSYPPRGVGGELVSALHLKLIDRAHEAYEPDLDEIFEGDAVGESFSVLGDESEVGEHERFARAFLGVFVAVGEGVEELAFLSRREEGVCVLDALEPTRRGRSLGCRFGSLPAFSRRHSVIPWR